MIAIGKDHLIKIQLMEFSLNWVVLNGDPKAYGEVRVV